MINYKHACKHKLYFNLSANQINDNNFQSNKSIKNVSKL